MVLVEIETKRLYLNRKKQQQKKNPEWNPINFKRGFIASVQPISSLAVSQDVYWVDEMTSQENPA